MPMDRAHPTTSHRVFFESAARMAAVAAKSAHLVVTSPPYPMIAMWDEVFAAQAPRVETALARQDGRQAFEEMHRVLDPVWDEVVRILVPGGLVCINIGDATRSMGEIFRLYPNHARILNAFEHRGLSVLPAILWRKQTNAPNKFMGSGMLPAGAYVTLEHEYILILRKGSPRRFASAAEKQVRRESAFFWEERNSWFSDIWFDLKGARQKLSNGESRLRSGAFPLELAYRLICMYSVQGDTVVDPFAGTGTTLLAAMAAARNSIGYELSPEFAPVIGAQAAQIRETANALIAQRLAAHEAFVRDHSARKGPPRHTSRHYDFPVVTRQEIELQLPPLAVVEAPAENVFVVHYGAPPPETVRPAAGPAPATTGRERPLPGFA
jgi:DNA modification methylase